MSTKKDGKDGFRFAETENSKGICDKAREAAAKEGRSLNNWLEQLFLSMFQTKKNEKD